ncbi:hypothetical protein [Paenibacillus sp. NPDC058071]|uniref:hypothetical protein n=1 Tax=Paenibacillus sp. NPDC058071 TaxID=3346326 RepID=UPI0036DE2831
MKLITATFLILFLITGCSSPKEEKPFILSYEFNKIDPKHEAELQKWLHDAKEDQEIKIHNIDLDGYKYSYVKGYKDVEVSYIHERQEGKLKQRFIKGTENDEVFVQIKYNTSICCTGSIYETDDSEPSNN